MIDFCAFEKMQSRSSIFLSDMMVQFFNKTARLIAFSISELSSSWLVWQMFRRVEIIKLLSPFKS